MATKSDQTQTGHSPAATAAPGETIQRSRVGADRDAGGGQNGDDRLVREEYQNRLGDRLRSLRTQQDMTLQEVEDTSDGQWKAVVVGSYERGDRAVSMPKLAGLADFYGVPLSELLPRTEQFRETDEGSQRGSARSHAQPVVLDLTRLEEGDLDPMLAPLSRFVQTIQVQRGDYNGQVMTVRDDDVLALSVVYDMEPSEFVARLDGDGILADTQSS